MTKRLRGQQIAFFVRIAGLGLAVYVVLCAPLRGLSEPKRSSSVSERPPFLDPIQVSCRIEDRVQLKQVKSRTRESPSVLRLIPLPGTASRLVKDRAMKTDPKIIRSEVWPGSVAAELLGIGELRRYYLGEISGLLESATLLNALQCRADTTPYMLLQSTSPSLDSIASLWFKQNQRISAGRHRVGRR